MPLSPLYVDMYERPTSLVFEGSADSSAAVVEVDCLGRRFCWLWLNCGRTLLARTGGVIARGPALYVHTTQGG